LIEDRLVFESEMVSDDFSPIVTGDTELSRQLGACLAFMLRRSLIVILHPVFRQTGLSADGTQSQELDNQ
jgi:hypothetical protein